MNGYKKNYHDPQILYLGLAGGEREAIAFLFQTTLEMLRGWRKTKEMERVGLAEIAEDATITTIRAIETGEFVFEGKSPCAYANRAAHNLLRNHFRKRKISHLEIQEWDAVEDPAIEKYLHDKAIQRLLAEALQRLSENCRQLITLFHLEQKTDEETLREGLTSYSSVRSLASSRGECMKKLRVLMLEIKKNL